MNRVPKGKGKDRNYSFLHSKRLPQDRMTEVNGIKIPSIPGTCYHAIICTLADNKDKFCFWAKIFEQVAANMRKYGGEDAWKKFIDKGDVKTIEQRIKENVHTLTRRGKDCYGFRLHEMGMAIYYFKDGAMLVTGGTMKKHGSSYDVHFSDGRKLQTRYRGTTMTFREYRRFLEAGLVDASGTILSADGIRDMRVTLNKISEQEKVTTHVCVKLSDGYDQETAVRLEKLGLRVEYATETEVIGVIPPSRISELKEDKDVVEVEASYSEL
jgi:hypothetical protein